MNANPLRQPTDQEVQKEAYRLYLAGGCVPGRDLEYWFAARERLCRGQAGGARQPNRQSTGSLHFPPSAELQRNPAGTNNPFSQRN